MAVRRTPRPGLAMALVVALAAAGNAASNLLVPAALLYATLVRIPLGTVLLEETLFRGVLLGLGLRRWPRRVAVAWSSALFGLWHVLPSGGLASYNPVVADLLDGPAGRLAVTTAAVAATALAGVVLCWLRLRAGSLLAPVMLHAATNSLAYAAAWTVLS